MRLQTCLLALVSLASMAQPNTTLDGSWLAKFNATDGKPYEAKVVVRADSGSWQILARAKGNPCVGREMPITINKVEPESFEFGMTGSRVLTGCEDFVVQMKRIDDKSFEGALADGRKLLLVRQ